MARAAGCAGHPRQISHSHYELAMQIQPRSKKMAWHTNSAGPACCKPQLNRQRHEAALQ